MANIKCAIQWIDCEGVPTPDSNDAVGYAVLKSDNRRFPICADHAELLHAGRTHHQHDCPHRVGPDGIPLCGRDPMAAVWTFEPLSSEAAS